MRLQPSHYPFFLCLTRQPLGTVTSFFVATGTDLAGCTITATDIKIHDGHVVVSTSGNSNCAGLYVAGIWANSQLSAFYRTFAGGIQSLDVTSSGTLLLGGALDGAIGGRVLSSRSASCSRVSETIRFATDAAFYDIDSCGSTAMAGGTDGLAVLTTNNGLTWRILTTPTSDDIRSVGVSGSDLWIGTDVGDLYMSCNQGYSWSLVASVTQSAEYQVSGAQNNGSIEVIEFANKHIGYFASGNELWGTYSGGAYWGTDCPRFEMSASMKHSNIWTPALTLPPIPHYYTALAIPTCSDAIDASNRFAMAINGTVGLNSNVVYAEPMIEGMGFNY